MIAMETSYSTTDVCRITGLTYRMLDHWARTGVIVPEVRESNGSGSRREWSEAQLEHLRVMKHVHQYLARHGGAHGVNTDMMHSLALALQEHRPWRIGIFVSEDGVVEVTERW